MKTVRQETEIYILGTLQTQKRVNPNKSIPRHIIIKLLKNKDKDLLKTARKNWSHYPYGTKEINYNASVFLIRRQEGQKEMARHIPYVEKKKIVKTESYS